MSVTVTFIILGIIFLAVQAVLLWFFLRRKGEVKDEGQGLMLIQNQIQELTRVLDTRVAESSKQVHETVRTQLGESAKLIREVTEGLTKLDETNRQVVSFADQLQSLQDILKNPKQRGILGEYYLETVLKNVLPPGSYQLQYPFKDGTIVDAVVFVKDKIIPIDSKFSLENYSRLAEERDPARREQLEKAFKADLKNRIDETAKYVKPSEGTMDFAFMFIPHEAIYYDLLVSQVGAIKVNTRDLIEYAFKDRRVVIVSPTSFHAFLQTVLQGLKALQIEERVEEVITRVDELKKHLQAYDEYHMKLGNALGTVVNHYNASSKEFKKIDKDVLKISGNAIGVEPLALEKPAQE